MEALIELPRPTGAFGLPLPIAATPRAVALVEFDRRMDNLRSCVHWLVENDVKVLTSAMSRCGGVVTVANSVRLHKLLGRDYTWRKRRQDGALTIFTLFAIRFDTRVEWEEVQPCV